MGLLMSHPVKHAMTFAINQTPRKNSLEQSSAGIGLEATELTAKRNAIARGSSLVREFRVEIWISVGCERNWPLGWNRPGFSPAADPLTCMLSAGAYLSNLAVQKCFVKKCCGTTEKPVRLEASRRNQFSGRMIPTLIGSPCMWSGVV